MFNLEIKSYLVNGQLAGNIFAAESLTDKAIIMLFHKHVEVINGTLFQKHARGVFTSGTLGNPGNSGYDVGRNEIMIN